MAIQSGRVSMTSIHPEWHLDEGIGFRTADQVIQFAEPFESEPTLVLSIVEVKLAHDSGPFNFSIRTAVVAPGFFELRFGAEESCRVQQATASWIAYTD